jgi:SAM-dependent methyltransferase
MKCPLCLHETANPVFTVSGYPIEKCASCGLIRVERIPDPEVLDKLYSDAYYRGSADSQGYYDYAAERRALSMSFRKRLEALNSHTAGGRLLDVGCAMGFLLDQARTMGWEPWGVDRSEYGILWGREHLGLKNLYIGAVDEVGFEHGSFDAVTVIDVLEHATDPVSLMRSIAALLKPGGVILIDTWDAGSNTARLLGRRWPIYAPPDHLFYFDRQTVRLLLENAGFQIRSISRMGRYMSPATLATKIPASFPAKNFLLKLLARQNWPVPINLHDNMVVIAVRGDA